MENQQTTGLGPMDVQGVTVPVKAGRIRDGRICVCGHGARSHGAVGREFAGVKIDEVPRGSVACSVGRHACECSQFIPVLETSDTRRFMSKTVGPGEDHALMRGVNNALNAGASIVWASPLVCGKCGESRKLLPVAIKMTDMGPRQARETTEHNFLLCSECRESVPMDLDRSVLVNVNLPGNRA